MTTTVWGTGFLSLITIYVGGKQANHHTVFYFHNSSERNEEVKVLVSPGGEKEQLLSS